MLLGLAIVKTETSEGLGDDPDRSSGEPSFLPCHKTPSHRSNR